MTVHRDDKPLEDLLKIGRLPFTPVLHSTGKRLDLEVDYHLYPSSKSPGYHGIVQDLKSGKWFAVFGKECELPGCNCDAWVEEISVIRNLGKLPEWCNVYEDLSEAQIKGIEAVILERANMTRFVRPALVELAQTCQFVPAQWEGRTDDDRPIYIKGRGGILSARIGGSGGTLHDAVQGEELTRIPREDADVLTSEDIQQILSHVLDFSKLKRIDNRCDE